MSTSEHYVHELESLDWQVAQDFEANFRWEYADGRDKLLTLYRKGKRQQRDSDTRIDWSQDLHPENPAGMPDEMIAIFGSPVWQRMDAKERTRLRHNVQSWQLSQFRLPSGPAIPSGATTSGSGCEASVDSRTSPRRRRCSNGWPTV